MNRFLALLLILVPSAASSQTFTRSMLLDQNTAGIIPYAGSASPTLRYGAVAPQSDQGLFQNFIQASGLLADANVWTGANTFTGATSFTGSLNFPLGPFLSSNNTWTGTNTWSNDATFNGLVTFSSALNLGTPSTLVLTNATGTPTSIGLANGTGLPISTGVSGLGTGIATALGVNTGSTGSVTLFNGALGTPSSGTLTNATGLPISTGVSGLGSGVATALAAATLGPGGLVPLSNITADGYVAQDAQIASGASVLYSASKNCAAADADKVVVIAGAGAGSGPLHAYVAHTTPCTGNGWNLVTVSGGGTPATNASGVDIGPIQVLSIASVVTSGTGTASAPTCIMKVSGGTLTNPGDEAIFTGALDASGHVQFGAGLTPLITTYGAYTVAPTGTISVTEVSGCTFSVLPTFTITTSGMQWSIVTDQALALNTLAAASLTKEIDLPCGMIGLDSQAVTLYEVKLRGCGPMPGKSTSEQIVGTTFLVTSASATQQVFVIKPAVSLSNFNMFWPDQYGVTQYPVPHGPVIEDNGTKGIQDFYVDHVTFINPYDLGAQTAAYHGCQTIVNGQCTVANLTPGTGSLTGSCQSISTEVWTNWRAYVVHDFYQLCGIGQAVDIDDTDVNPNVYATASTGNSYLGVWSGDNGTVFEGWGNGWGLQTVTTAGTLAGAATITVSTADATNINTRLATGDTINVFDKTALAAISNKQVQSVNTGTGVVTLNGNVSAPGVGSGDELAFAGACGTSDIGGLDLKRFAAHEFNRWVYLHNANLVESTWQGINMGSINQFMYVDNSSHVGNLQMLGGVIQTGKNKKTGTVTEYNTIDYEGVCSAPGNMEITGVTWVPQGGILYDDSHNLNIFTFTGNKVAMGLTPNSISNPLYLAYFNDPTVDATITGNVITGGAPTTSSILDAVAVVNVDKLSVTGNTGANLDYFFDLAAQTAAAVSSPYIGGAVSVSGNTTGTSRQATTVNVGTAAPVGVVFGTNNFDKPFAAPALTGTCSTDTQVGGNTIGSFQAAGACAGTVIVTFKTTAAHGWSCPQFTDTTTIADTFAFTSSTTTSITMTGTAADNDVIQFQCQAY